MTRLDIVRHLVSEGQPNAVIAHHLGLSERQVTRLKRKAGIEPPKRSVLTQEQIDEIIRLSRDEGWPPREIMDTMPGVTLQHIQWYADKQAGRDYQGLAGWAANKYNKLWHELRD